MSNPENVSENWRRLQCEKGLAGPVRTLIPGERVQVGMAPGVGGDLVALVVRVLDPPCLVSVINALVCGYNNDEMGECAMIMGSDEQLLPSNKAQHISTCHLNNQTKHSLKKKVPLAPLSLRVLMMS
jgi:hypothetical protein